MHSVPITTNVVSSNCVHGTVYSIQQYVIKFVSDLRQVGGFLWVLQFHDITEIVLKVALNRIILTHKSYFFIGNL
jgi:hypothetical protein